MKNDKITFQDCWKTFTEDQDKAMRPEETLRRFYQQVAQLEVSIVSEVKRIDTGRLDIPVFFSVCSDEAQRLTGTKKQMGKGASPVQAEASACMELVERFSFYSYLNCKENFLRGDYVQMCNAGYPVMDIRLLLASVHDSTTSRETLEALLEDMPMEWAWATNVTTGERVLVPFSWFFAINEFNGSSAGNTKEEAALQGLCEVVERHVCARISEQEMRTSPIDPASVTDPVAKELLDKFAREGIELYLNDFTLDMGISTVAALAIDRTTFPEQSEIVYTAGTTPSPEKSLIRAVTEVAQLGGDFITSSNYMASGLPKPLSMDEVRYVTEAAEEVSIATLPDLSHDNIKTELERCISCLKEKNYQVFMIDVTDENLGIPACYTIIPGAHFRERAKSHDVGLFVAKLLFEMGDNPGIVEERLSRLETLLPRAYYLEFYRGKNALNMGAIEAAVVHFDRALQYDPEIEDRPAIASYLGSCLKDIGKYDEAIAVLQRGLDDDEERQDIHNSLGVCWFKKEDYEQAIVHFKRAVALDPSSGIDYANIGVNYARLGKAAEAIEYFTIALTIDPSLDFAHNELEKLRANKEK